MDLTPQQQALLLRAAREVIRRAVILRLREEQADPHAVPNPPDGCDAILLQPAGCFVSLHELHSRRLRGCVGRLDARHPLWLALHHTAIGVLHDPRFAADPVKNDELAMLEIEITVLSPLSDCGHVLDFEPQRDGIYLTIGEQSGCFLPQVARDTGWSREQLLDRLCAEKLGMAPSSWRSAPGVKLQKFTTLIIGPEPFETALMRTPFPACGNDLPAC